jgi:hypothetical protein
VALEPAVGASPGHAHHGIGVQQQRFPERRGHISGDAERKVVSHHRSAVAERVEAGLAVVGAHPAAAHATERRRRRNHLCGNVVADHPAAAGVAHEGAEVGVIGPVPKRGNRRLASIDVVDGVAQTGIPLDDEDRPEDLLGGDPHAVIDAAHDGGRDLVGGAVGQRIPLRRNGYHRCTVGVRVLDQAGDADRSSPG